MSEIKLPVDDTRTVSAILDHPQGAKALYVMAHGAGAGMRHTFMETMAAALHEKRIATFRFNFPFMEKGRRRVNSVATASQTIRAAAAYAESTGLPLFAGGKSFGGRMSSNAQADEPLSSVRGLIFLGFPLHSPKKPDTKRADHLSRVAIPMLFLQGTRDKLAELDLLKPIVKKHPLATLHVLEGADHGFAVLKRSGRTAEQVIQECAHAIDAFVDLGL